MSASSLGEDLPYDEIEEEGEGESVEEPSIYYSEDFISGPKLSEQATLPGNILEFEHSFGYDCKRYYNLTVADENTLIFASGNLINFFDVNTKQVWFRRSAYGGGIGHITKNPNPNYKHIAVGENGVRPPIIVYEWPSLEIICLLKGGTTTTYSHLSYSPDGTLLVSQGGEPDYLITIFTWTKSRIMLRTKSYVNDVYRVMFSPDVPGQLTSCGLAHIKFWKMAQTFTGLKLQGELGRFGKTEFSDILGIYPMPDEKVVSGSYWGNILIWDEGLIKVEVCRKLRKTCHDDAITQFYYSNGDLWTVGMDGRIRVWFYDTIDQADPPEDDKFVQVEPIYDFYTPGVQYMCIYKQNNDPNNTFYYAQDGHGGLWRIDLNTDREPQPSEQLYKCHAGAVVDVSPCPWGPYLASLGVDGRLQLYHYIDLQLLFIHQYPAKGACLIWLPVSMQPSGDELIMGFDDGNLRVVALKIGTDVDNDPTTVTTLQIIKPHNRPVLKISINATGTVLISAGQDSTLFMFKLSKRPKDYTLLEPIGYIVIPGIATYVTWHHELVNLLLVGCIRGDYLQVQVPEEPQDYTTVTYILHLEPKARRFETYKAQIRRDIKIAEMAQHKAERLEKKKKKLEQTKKDNPGLEIDEELFLQDSEPEEVLEPLFIPEIPNQILWLQSTEEGTIWLNMAGYDAGYIYEYYMDQPTNIPAKFQIIYDSDDIEINNFCYSPDKKYLLLAMQDGSIRVIKRNPQDWRDWTDYWQLSMHDNLNGFINRMCFSYNSIYFFTCGNDGNIFSYKFYPEEELPQFTEKPPVLTKIVNSKITPVEDVDGYTKLSLEEAIVRKELDRQTMVANENKRLLRVELQILKERFEAMLSRNFKLPSTQIIPRCELEIDSRITQHLDAQLAANLALVKRKLAFPLEKSKIGLEKLKDYFTNVVDVFPITVKGINIDKIVSVMRQRGLTDDFNNMLVTIEQKIIEEELRNRPPERQAVVVEAPPPPEKKKRELEYFLIGLSPSTIQHKLGAKLTRLLGKYRKRKCRIEKRQKEWDAFEKRKPQQNVNDPDDEQFLNNAIETIGDFKLKTASDFKVPYQLRVTTVKKYKQLLHVRLRQFNLRHNYNKKIYALRNRKVELHNHLVTLTNNLYSIHEEIQENLRKFGPNVPPIEPVDFIEKNLNVQVQVPKTLATERKEANKKMDIIRAPKDDLLEKEVLTVTALETDVEESDEEESFFIKCTQEDSPWEVEVREYRNLRQLFNQDYVINKMKGAISEFDEALIKTFEERLQVSTDVTYMDNFILTLHQELLILRDFEAVENKLQEKVNARVEELFDMKDIIQDINSKIDMHKREIDRLSETEKEIIQKFFTAVTDNKFYDFLRRIFRKKYRPPKIHTDDDESSSDSSDDSEESEEEDAGSVDSKDFAIVRLDENTCPKGCELYLYNMTFELRTTRHGVELQIKDERATIDSLKKDLDISNKKTRVIEGNLKVCQTELEAYQREKQRKLNEVMCLVILRLDQLQHLTKENECNNVTNTLVFLQSTLSQLYRRVGELYQETLQQKAKHRSNINHLVRMRNDCKHMEMHIESLKVKVKERMKIKFGCEVDVDELEEVSLKRMVLELRLSQVDVRSMCEIELNLWNKRYGEKQTELTQAIRDNTSRLELLAMLNREKKELARIIDHQSKKREQLKNAGDITDAYKEELNKLSEIVRFQLEELRTLKTEIKRLRTKGPGPEPIYSEPAEPEEKGDISDDWQSGDFIYELKPKKETDKIPLSTRIRMNIKEDTRKSIEEMVQAIGCFDDMSKASRDIYIPLIAEGDIPKENVYEIVDYLIAHLPIEKPTDEQQSIIETTAEKLFTLQHSESTIDTSEKISLSILNQLLDKLAGAAGTPAQIITNMLNEIIKTLPCRFLSQEGSIDAIVDKIKQTFSTEECLDVQETIQDIFTESFSRSAVPEEVYEVLNKILERIFGSGIDYLFYIRHS